MLLTVFFDLTYGVIGGLLLTLIVNFKNLIKPFKIEVDSQTIKLDGAVYFLTIDKVVSTLKREFNDCDHLVLDFEKVNTIDCSSVEKLAKLNGEILHKNKSIEFINLNSSIKNKLDRYLAYMM